MNEKKRIKLFLIIHYCILTLTFIICYVNPKIPNWLYKDYTVFDYFLWYYEKFAFLIMLPVLFVMTIVLLVRKRDCIKSKSPFFVSLLFDFVIGVYCIAIYVARF
jgi:hypothetical protein